MKHILCAVLAIGALRCARADLIPPNQEKKPVAANAENPGLVVNVIDDAKGTRLVIPRAVITALKDKAPVPKGSWIDPHRAGMGVLVFALTAAGLWFGTGARKLGRRWAGPLLLGLSLAGTGYFVAHADEAIPDEPKAKAVGAGTIPIEVQVSNSAHVHLDVPRETLETLVNAPSTKATKEVKP